MRCAPRTLPRLWTRRFPLGHVPRTIPWVQLGTFPSLDRGLSAFSTCARWSSSQSNHLISAPRIGPRQGCLLPNAKMSTSSPTPSFTNRLAKEKSPYLLQHAHNPVDWYPWGEEAIETARKENKPIFLSVGYSTCHWCHVMEHESFENPMIADVMNRFFVNIKVDREELPAVDKLYMTFVQATTGHGGWPMSCFLTPDLQPFYGGTYFPATDSSYGQPSFLHVLNHLGKMWQNEEKKIRDSAADIIALLKRNSTSTGVEKVSKRQVGGMAEKMQAWMESGYDARWGGFGRAPKFPSPPQMVFLTRVVSRGHVLRDLLQDDGRVKELADRFSLSAGDVEEEIGKREEMAESAAEWLRFTLEKIAQGGIHDHVCSGFHRYSVDGEWHVPHFEKMLYDQGQLLSLYATTHLLTASPSTPPELDFSLIAADILAYLASNLVSPHGGFYCAEDADSLPSAEDAKKREGAFAVWTEKEVREILVKEAGMSSKELEVFEYYFDVHGPGNVKPGPTDPHGELKGQNVLRVLRSVGDVAGKFGVGEEEVRRVVAAGKAELKRVRATRPPPIRDDKILVAWNGLAISGLAKAHAFLMPDAATSEYLEKAIAAADFIQREMYDTETKGLRRTYLDGPGSKGVAEDYAFLIQGLLDLYEAMVLSDAQGGRYLEFAADLQEYLDANFWDSVGWGYFTGAKNPTSEERIGEATDFVLLRTKEDHDGAEPSPNSVSLANLLRLEGMITARAQEGGSGISYGERAERIVSAFFEQCAKYPQTMPAMVAAVEDWKWGLEHIVVNGASKEALSELRRSKMLARTVVRADDFTRRYNKRVAQVISDDRSGVFPFSGKL